MWREGAVWIYFVNIKQWKNAFSPVTGRLRKVNIVLSIFFGEKEHVMHGPSWFRFNYRPEWFEDLRYFMPFDGCEPFNIRILNEDIVVADMREYTHIAVKYVWWYDSMIGKHRKSNLFYLEGNKKNIELFREEVYSDRSFKNKEF